MLPSIDEECWVPAVRETDALLAWGGDPVFLAYWMRRSGQGELSYVVGPPIVILCAAKVSPGVVAWGVGAAIVTGGAGIRRPPLRLWHGGNTPAGLSQASGHQPFRLPQPVPVTPGGMNDNVRAAHL